MSISYFPNQRADLPLRYESPVEEAISRLSEALATIPTLAHYSPRWLAIQLLEDDDGLAQQVQAAPGGEAVLHVLAEQRDHLRTHYNDAVDITLTDQRYRFVHQITQRVLTRPDAPDATLSDTIDRIVTHKYLGIPIFLALMWIVFKITADVSAPMLDWVDGVISGPLTNWVVALLSVAGLGGTWVESLAVDGVIAGVGGVLVFVPVLLALYFALALLEDSGYMARAAFVMDRLMRALGLHGKSFLPMIVGFGCNVPAIYATRTLESERDRILTGLLVPFMSCSARLPVYILLAAIFFPAYAGVAVFSMYLLGIIVAILLGVVFKHTLFRSKEQMPFILELPPYRLPTLRGIWTQMWERTASFVRKAWTIILATSLVVWLLIALPVGGQGRFADTELDQSAFATVSGVVAPIFAPLGFGSWESSGALVTGFVAKEVVISTMGQIYGLQEAEEAAAPTTFLEDVSGIATSFVSAVGDTLKSIPLIVGINLFEEEEEAEPTALMGAIEAGFEESSGGHGVLAALAFMVFVLLYTPCMVTAAATRQEFGNVWMWVSIIGQFALAWVVALLVFQGGLLLGLG
ncbi:MAG: ferrous iron transport protein B [Chloroflexaceae bacterium]|nr:ferrous iron transport protein B [Chloroflexaceae bacterium]NJO07647.1 ferrous iron transport protein B [Chloroflexaceae bacterium]